MVYNRFARYKENSSMVVIVDEGMSDAFCRTIANTKSSVGNDGRHQIDIPEPFTDGEIELSVKNTLQCVVGVQERWSETLNVINHWFPWIPISSDSKERLNDNNNLRKENERTIRPDLLKVIIDSNRCDLEVHSAVLRRFAEQLQHLLERSFKLS